MNFENHLTDFPESPLGRFGSTHSQPNGCDEIVPLIPAHSIGATDEKEAAQINALLAECPRTAADLTSYQQIAMRLLYSAPPAIAPPAVAERLRRAIGLASAPSSAVSQTARPRLPFMRRVVQRKARAMPRPKHFAPLPAAMADYSLQPDLDVARFGQPLRLVPGKAPKPSRLWHFVRPLAVAAAVALVVANVGLLLQNGQLQTQQELLVAELAQQNRTQELMAAELAQQNRALIFLAAEDPQEIEISDPAGQSPARADVLWNNSLGLAVIYVRDFPECEAGMKYQLWLTKDGKRTSGGLFSVDASGMGLLVLSLDYPFDLYDVIGITPEPAGGSPGPTSPPVVRGKI